MENEFSMNTEISSSFFSLSRVMLFFFFVRDEPDFCFYTHTGVRNSLSLAPGIWLSFFRLILHKSGRIETQYGVIYFCSRFFQSFARGQFLNRIARGRNFIVRDCYGRIWIQRFGRAIVLVVGRLSVGQHFSR